VGIIGFFGIVYLGFTGVWNWESVFFISSNPVLNYFWGENCVHPSFVFPTLHLVLCNYVLDRLVGGFSHLFSFPWFDFVLWLYWVFS
jgi:hypothetical protein